MRSFPGIKIVLVLVISFVVLFKAVLFLIQRDSSSASSVAAAPEIKKPISELSYPSLEEIPEGSQKESVLRGKDYLENTHLRLPKYVQAKINCTSCHLNLGTTPNAGPWVGIITKFPQYRSRSGKMDSLEDRVNDCFERSLNGKRLPETGEVMSDIMAYMTWISKNYKKGDSIPGSGMPKLKLTRAPDLVHGRKVYDSKCAQCHQSGGQGLAPEGQRVVFPPLWGKSSFNIGAGMARLQTAAGFVKANMPQGQGGTLTDDEAWDVAAYFTTQSRPDFIKKKQDWPKGDKPEDARY